MLMYKIILNGAGAMELNVLLLLFLMVLHMFLSRECMRHIQIELSTNIINMDAICVKRIPRVDLIILAGVERKTKSVKTNDTRSIKSMNLQLGELNESISKQ